MRVRPYFVRVENFGMNGCRKLSEDDMQPYGVLSKENILFSQGSQSVH